MMRPMAIKLMINVLCNFNLRELYDKLHYGTSTHVKEVAFIVTILRGKFYSKLALVLLSSTANRYI